METSSTTKAVTDGQFRDHAANERTMLAWLRTGIALMAFGFAIARFALFLRQVAYVRDASAPHAPGLGSTWFGVALVVLGLIVNAAATLRYEKNRKAIRDQLSISPSPIFVFVVGIGTVIIAATMATVLGVSMR